MIIGHLPAGYVASKLMFGRFRSTGVALKPFLWAGVVGAIAPDFDMAYFLLIDHRQHHHHTYLTHFPIVWFTLLLLSTVWLYASRSKTRPALATIFALNGCIHLVLDSIVGDVWWLAPFVDKPVAFFIVPALYKPWWLNFLLHWSFALELAVVIWAIYLWRRSPSPIINGGAKQPMLTERRLNLDDKEQQTHRDLRPQSSVVAAREKHHLGSAWISNFNSSGRAKARRSTRH